MEREKIRVEKKEVEGKTFYFLDVGEEEHGRPSFRLWINGQLVQSGDGDGEYISFPIHGRIIRTEKGNYVLRPEQGWNTFRVGVPCGYRGTSTFEVLSKGAEVFPFESWMSPQGNLGISKYALVSIPSDKVKVRWERDGRLYGDAPRGISIYYSDGKVEKVDGLPDGLGALEELKGEL